MPNEEMIRCWNEMSGPRWVRMQPRLDAQIAHLAQPLLDEVQAGESVLDVGCGCAQTTLELAERVGPTGRVTGIDVARPMLAHAEERARAHGADNVSFVAADAQTHALPAESFDRVFSRFGVMFFDDPAAAFSNLRRAMRPGARLGFLCWQAMEKNEWVRVPLGAVMAHVEPPSRPEPGAPGPFSLCDRDRVSSLLEGAGFEDVTIESQERSVGVGGGMDLDEAVEFSMQIGVVATLIAKADEAVRPRVEDALRRALEPYQTPRGIELASASWLVRARA